jgi:hypothetical protein
LRHPVFRGQKYVPKGYRLRLPYRNDENWQILVTKIEDKFYKHYQKKSRIYTVQRGDTAGEIARIHGVKLADLIAANNLNSRATIYVNQNLRIPLPDDKPVLVAKHQPKTPPQSKDAVASPSKQAESGVPNREEIKKRLDIASQSVGQTSGLSRQNARVVEAGHPLEPVGGKVSDNTRQEGRKESPTGPPDNNLIVDFPMVEYLPARQQSAQPPVETADLVSDDVEGTGGTEALLPVPVNEMHDKAIARLSDNQQSKEMKVGDVPESEPSTFPPEKSEPLLSREMETRSATPAIKSPQNNPEVVLAHLVVLKTWIQNGKQVGIIQVEVEETIGHYAEWLNVAAGEIRHLNGFSYEQALHLNRKIRIPLHRVTQEEFVEKRFEYHQELAEDFFASYRVEKVLTYAIKRGDNIWTLSHQEFQVPLWLIRIYNAGVDFSALVPSQKLLIPIIEKKV